MGIPFQTGYPLHRVPPSTRLPCRFILGGGTGVVGVRAPSTAIPLRSDQGLQHKYSGCPQSLEAGAVAGQGLDE